ncbi:hypothetical protein TNCV_4272381 [Trichonephila clavipes]|nr:hypothetical protein TNCV_4272381 [Trichonephila clavipes]
MNTTAFWDLPTLELLEIYGTCHKFVKEPYLEENPSSFHFVFVLRLWNCWKSTELVINLWKNHIWRKIHLRSVDKVTLWVETSVPIVPEVAVLVAEPIFSSSLDLIIIEKSPSIQSSWVRTEDVARGPDCAGNVREPNSEIAATIFGTS